MGRGLSKLQRFILKEAATVPVLRRADVLEDYFGWKPISRRAQKFSREYIGARRYNSVMASLCRACRRLEQRGMVEYEAGTALRLTDQGRNWLASYGAEPDRMT